MVDVFWINSDNTYSEQRKLLEAGTRESIKTLSIEKLEEYKEDLPTFSLICFEANNESYEFLKKYELSFDDQLIIFICSKDEQEKLAETLKSLNNPQRVGLTLDPFANQDLMIQNFRTIVKLAHISRGAREFSIVGKNLNKLVATSLHEIDRLRKLHQRIVSLRSESIKGLSVMSKFAAGEAPGGEFFDMIKGDSQLLIMVTSSKSYVTTSVLLTYIDQLRSLKKFTNKDIENYISSVYKDLGGSEGVEGLEAIFIILDNKNLNAEVYSFGESVVLNSDGFLISGNENSISPEAVSTSVQKIKLARDQKILIASPGLMKMTAGIINNEPILDFFKSQSNKTCEEVLNELFFHLKKNSKGNFLNRDVSSLMIEVGQNVMLEVE